MALKIKCAKCAKCSQELRGLRDRIIQESKDNYNQYRRASYISSGLSAESFCAKKLALYQRKVVKQIQIIIEET